MNFETIKNFIVDNWQFISIVLSILLSLIFTLVFKKKPKVIIPDDTIASVFGLLPKWINEAEDKFGAGHGKEKLNHVIYLACSYLAQSLGITVASVYSFYGLNLKEAINNIMATPKSHKGKEVKARE